MFNFVIKTIVGERELCRLYKRILHIIDHKGLGYEFDIFTRYSRIPMEAHLCSKPIVANAVGGVRISIVKGENRFLVQAGDIQAFPRDLSHFADTGNCWRAWGVPCAGMSRTSPWKR